MSDRPDSAPSTNERITHDTHGQSIAAWAAVGVLLLGSIALAIGVVVLWWWLIIVGVVLLVAGPVVGIGLSKAGYGAGGAKDSFTNSPHHH